MAYDIIAASYGAQFYLPNPDGSAAGFYRIHPVPINDGTVNKSLQFLSHTGSWVGSVEPDREAFMKRLISINSLGDLAMGYSHYFTLKKPIPPADWAKIKTIAGKILAKAAADGIQIEDESDGTDVTFNGVGKDAHETFYLDPNHLGFYFCKTANKPYDVVVTAILAAIHTETKGEFYDIRSDGDAKDWLDGIALADEALGLVYSIENPIVDKIPEALPL
jgi:hypothetical protein